ncbi:MAG TPA: MBL fold metallo-hydrolase [Capillimicrobium sp.]|nr:MBL fold metallo-hydrolase [Capillimicrobium sp.]
MGRAMQLSMSRRTLLGGAGVAAGALAAGRVTGAQAAADGRPANGERSDRRTRVVLLGTAGGPSVYADRLGVSTAIAVEDAFYLVDCGHGAAVRLRQSELGNVDAPRGRSFEGLRAIFLTHLHSDHVVDVPAFHITGMWNGLDDPARPVDVHGPGDRAVLPPMFGDRPEPPVIAPEDPTPGTVKMFGHLQRAFATDLNDRIRSSGASDPLGIIRPHDIALPPGAGDDPNGQPSPPVEPFPVFEDERVRVTATLVDHAPVFPSFGFRFDTDDGAIAISGDTAPSDNLVRLARDADVLVHEVIDAAWVEGLFPPPHTPETEALIAHLLESHTTIEDVGGVGQRAGARRLVLNHMVPVDNPEGRWRQAQRGYDGRLTVGRDLMQIGVGRGRLSPRPRPARR